MMSVVMRWIRRSRALLTLSLGLLGTPSGAQADLGAAISRMVAEPAVARAHWGVVVTGMDGTPIFARNAGQLFQPASNAKLFTTAAAVHLLGESRRFTTLLEGAVPAPDGTMAGDLVLRGGGDANLSGREVPYANGQGERPKFDPLRYLAEMADGVAASGVKHIAGDVVADDTLFPWQPYAPDWAADDLLWGYGAPVSALTVTDNQLVLKVTPGAKAGDAAAVTLEPRVPFYSVAGRVDTVAAKKPTALGVERALGSRVLTVSGTIAADAGVDAEEVAISDPAEFAASALKGLLEARGIAVEGRARAEHRVVAEAGSFLQEVREPLPGLRNLAALNRVLVETGCSDACPVRVQHTSATVMEDVVVTNKVSQNLHAELLLRQLGKAYGKEGSIAQGMRVVRQFLLNAGVDGEDFMFYDGSGLSGHDLVTPRAVAKLLQFAVRQAWFADWRNSLPVGGVDGSLEGRFTKAPLRGHVFAKTGTLGEARALSGYLECASGRTVIFSIMVGNHAPGTSADREVMDRMVAAIAASN